MVLSLEFVVVIGCLLLSVAAEMFVQPLKRSAIFLKERNLILNNDIWRIAINVEIETYAEALSVIKGDLLRVEQRKLLVLS